MTKLKKITALIALSALVQVVLTIVLSGEFIVEGQDSQYLSDSMQSTLEKETTLPESRVLALNGENDEKLEAWLDKLITYENCPWNGIIDSNGLRSYGNFCYQKATYLDFMARFSSVCMPHAEKSEWLNNLSDPNTQRCLTKSVILKDPGAYKHWYTSIVIRKGLGMPPVEYQCRIPITTKPLCGDCGK